MKFLTENQLQSTAGLMRFDLVEKGQFFVDNKERLCLKTQHDIATIITNSTGYIIADTGVYEGDDLCVARILHQYVAIVDY